jgi:hypothetical protein
MEWLRAMIGRPDLEVDFTIPEVVLGFPQLRNSLPTTMRMRVVLWHSAVVFTIAKLRGESLKAAKSGDEAVEFDLSGWKEILLREIWRILGDIKEGMGTDLKNFRELWIVDNELVELSNGQLIYGTLSLGG